MNKKKAILKAAIHLFAERGFKATPTSVVARKAGVAEGLIFHHFKNKEGIFVHILEEMIDAYIKGLETNIKEAATGMEAIENIVHFHLSFSEKRSKEALVVLRDFPFDLMTSGSTARQMIAERSARIYQLMAQCVQRGKEDGSLRNLSPEKTAFILIGMLNGISRLKMLGTLTAPEVTSEAVVFCRTALARHV